MRKLPKTELKCAVAFFCDVQGALIKGGGWLVPLLDATLPSANVLMLPVVLSLLMALHMLCSVC
jgi:hypothetical protein